MCGGGQGGRGEEVEDKCSSWRLPNNARTTDAPRQAAWGGRAGGWTGQLAVACTEEAGLVRVCKVGVESPAHIHRVQARRAPSQRDPHTSLARLLSASIAPSNGHSLLQAKHHPPSAPPQLAASPK